MFKRSRTQRSYVAGDDEISVVRNHQLEFPRPSRVDSIVSSTGSSSSDLDPSEYDVYESCVVRNFPKHKSSHLRFLAWVAYTRKYTDESITEDERRTCPLLWCRSQFKDQETMLKHVYNCPHLSKGLYWCFHCQKPERVGSFKCRRCQGAPSRTDRISSVAKKIFSKLGARPHRLHHTDNLKNLSRLPAYQQDDFEISSCSKGQSNFEGEWDCQLAQELPNDEIMLEMPADFSAASHELADTYVSELVGSTECPVELGTGDEMWADNFYIDEWESSAPIAPKIRVDSPKPRLSVDTSCSSSNLHNSYVKPAYEFNPFNWDDCPLSATIISPMSTSGGIDHNGFEISPTDSETSGNTFSTIDSGYASAASYTAPAWDFPLANLDIFQDIPDKKGKKRDIEQISQDPTNHTVIPRPQTMPIIPQPQDTSVSRSNSSSTTHSATRCPASEHSSPISPHWRSSADLAASFSTVLDSHITHTKSVLSDIPPSSMAQELLAISRDSLVSLGLDVLHGIIEGRNPTAVIQVWAFMHVALALTIAVDRDEAKVGSESWWQDCLGWVETLGSQRQRDLYFNIVRTVWEPSSSNACSTSRHEIADTGSQKLVFDSCKHFLDIFEYLHHAGTDLDDSQQTFNFVQATFERKAKTQVIDALIQAAGTEAFIEDIVTVERRLIKGQIASTRALELDLIFAGKLASQSETAYNIFVAQVTKLCDVLYEEDNSTSRKAYHVRNIAELKCLLPDKNYVDGYEEQGQQCEDEENDQDMFEGDLFIHFGLDEPKPGHKDNEDLRRELDDILSHPSTSRLHSSLIEVEKPIRQFEGPYFHTSSGNQSHLVVPSSTQHQKCATAPPSPTTRDDTETTKKSLLPHSFSRHSVSIGVPSPTTPNTRSLNTTTISTSPASTLACDICDYIPTGAPRWFASNLRRHKRTQHPSIPAKRTLYPCKIEGCKSVFRRSDNLRLHARDRHGIELQRGARGSGDRHESKEDDMEGVKED